MASIAVRAASRDGDASLRCRALAAFGLLHFNAGRGIPAAEMDEALRLERSLGGWLLLGGPGDRAEDRPRPPAVVVGRDRSRAGDLPRDPRRGAGAERALGGGDHPLVPGAPRMAGGELGRGRPPRRPCARDHDPARPRSRRTRVARGRSSRRTGVGSTTPEPWHERRRRARRVGRDDGRRVVRPAGSSASSSSLWATPRAALPHLDASHERSGTTSCSSRRSAWSSATCSRRSSPSASSTRRRQSSTAWEPRAPRSTGRGRSRSSRAAAGSCSRPGATSTARSRASSGRSPSTPAPCDPFQHARIAARARPDATAREEARRGARDARGRARTLRSSRRPALGRADPRRARPHRRPRAVAR